MKKWLGGMVVPLITIGAINASGQSKDAKPPIEAVERALTYLAREVPRWSRENHCFSCHNNGDAARALYRAERLGYPFDRQSLADTTNWLKQPGQWMHNPDDDEFGGKELASIQFGSALVDLLDTEAAVDRSPLRQAAESVASHQDADGSWKVDAEGTVGSPITYGTYLATAVSLRVLRSADPVQFRAPIERAESWLRTHPAKTVLGAGATLLALSRNSDPAAAELRRSCIALIANAQDTSGGWGPFIVSAPEPFDTAVVLIGLFEIADDPRSRPMIEKGRAFLIESQRGDGSWPETTRPPNANSYPQRMGTTGWATLALLATGTPGEAAANNRTTSR